MTKLVKIPIFFLLLVSLPLAGQGVRYTISPINAESVLKAETVQSTVEYLCDPVNGGRATGSEGGRKAAAWIASQFQEMGLEPLSGAFMHGFRSSEGMARNVIGFIGGSARPARYVVVMAHFDNLGTLGDTFYPGADSNASGVAALLEMGRMFKHMQSCKKSYSNGLVLVALDGKEKDQAGAKELWNALEAGRLLDPVSGNPIYPSQITLVVNLDQLGATLSPLTKGNPNYIMMLSDEATGRRSTLESVNRTQHIGLQLGYDYYGSKDFTKLFYERVSDQKVFLEHGIPSVMFTSGITLNNNKPYDDAASLDYTVLRKRIQLIFYYLDRVL